MKKLLLRIVLSKEERIAIKTLVDIYYPKVENPVDESMNKVKNVLEKLKKQFT